MQQNDARGLRWNTVLREILSSRGTLSFWKFDALLGGGARNRLPRAGDQLQETLDVLRFNGGPKLGQRRNDWPNIISLDLKSASAINLQETKKRRFFSRLRLGKATQIPKRELNASVEQPVRRRSPCESRAPRYGCRIL